MLPLARLARPGFFKRPDAVIAVGAERVEEARRAARELEKRGLRVKLIACRVRERDFPLFLSRLEELFGGVATYEYRKYGVSELPTVVYGGRKYTGEAAARLIRELAGGALPAKPRKSVAPTTQKTAAARGGCPRCPLNSGGVCILLKRPAPGSCPVRLRASSLKG